MKFFNTLLIAAAIGSSYIANVQACITAKADLDGRKSPSTSAARTSNVYKSGACINVKCQTTGSTLYGSNIWDYDGKYYLPDAYVKTGYSGFDPKIPRCGSTGGGSSGSGTGAAIVKKAQTQTGLPYSWGGGDNNGPTNGICCSPSGYDDRHVKGFDCSGLTKYAIYQVKKISLAHYTCSQYNDSRGKKIAFSSAQPGDLIFYGSDSQKCNEHVAIYAGNGKMVEAEQHGVPLGTHTIRSGHAPYVVRF
ncbi:hypothetical protein K450DRAFT_278409 [Umbelopsis ramanniana AG]|uniref:NlpC/P60 domain-containing protein n=1 Tax=Umbelopsis ramanniana AG TaxID=1314678 RepID=A0AAD5EET5_UMBRA|nr:uncharacterized protein K450DRAFT_278409 [Umbelopsis ramanniana AG]KAI8582368.1 hypothetical protein K450DRAFT_278409 [Umbelopsis ramanniana AG]